MLPRPVFVEEGFESSRGSLSVNGEVGQTDGLSFTRLDLRKIQFVPGTNRFPTALSVYKDLLGVPSHGDAQAQLDLDMVPRAAVHQSASEGPTEDHRADARRPDRTGSDQNEQRGKRSLKSTEERGTKVRQHLWNNRLPRLFSGHKKTAYLSVSRF